jgi:hypothetical protein
MSTPQTVATGNATVFLEHTEHETEKAICFGEDVWIPKSLILSMETLADGVRVTLPIWFIEKNRLGIGYLI